jgi:hypothetical protein
MDSPRPTAVYQSSEQRSLTHGLQAAAVWTRAIEQRRDWVLAAIDAHASGSNGSPSPVQAAAPLAEIAVALSKSGVAKRSRSRVPHFNSPEILIACFSSIARSGLGLNQKC